MRRPLLLSMAAILMLSPLGAFAGQGSASDQHRNSDPVKVSRKTVGISGMLGSDSKTFISDKDGRIWVVSNPESLSAIDGKHLKVRARVDGASREIEVVSVTAIVEMASGINYGDSAFRR